MEKLCFDEQNYFNHDKNLPNSFRMLIIGPSGCGKTNLLLNLILTPDYIDYNNLIIFSKTVYQQPEFKYIQDCFNYGYTKELIYHMFLNGKRPNFSNELNNNNNNNNNNNINDVYHERKIKVTLSNKAEEIQPPDKLEKTKKNLIIFDDVVNEKNQKIMEMYFTRGRHNKANVIYLSQSYFDLPLKSIRNNSNVLILFKLGKRDLSNIYYNLLSSFIEKDEFETLYNFHFNKEYNYIFINLNSKEILPSAF